jgi:hypothetical protein
VRHRFHGGDAHNAESSLSAAPIAHPRRRPVACLAAGVFPKRRRLRSRIHERVLSLKGPARGADSSFAHGSRRVHLAGWATVLFPAWKQDDGLACGSQSRDSRRTLHAGSGTFTAENVRAKTKGPPTDRREPLVAA